MSESLCFGGEHLVFRIVSGCSHFYSSVVLSDTGRLTEKECTGAIHQLQLNKSNQTEKTMWTQDI